ncbi:MerR family transcriptional regulator [Streptomyces sp. GXMU-J5]|uniref:MerR family transcriptional regulator n=2 Tax=Streptomyces beihaiensis TaxID=2984495 RepID=A0ABT3TYG9_9ACTN|nr:MerR family transcriptional regulator [Streptomyces beihaiensis]MCX3062092.1 MerR family transcriptional regulator [Streptomyces beihaiensis]
MSASAHQGPFTISEVSVLTGLSAPTLRWYEEIGVLPAVERTHTGRRVFSDRDVEWLSCVTALRLTGMPVAEMVRFAALVHLGAESYDERREILERTRRDVLGRIAELRSALSVIDTKIEFYAGGVGRVPREASEEMPDGASEGASAEVSEGA